MTQFAGTRQMDEVLRKAEERLEVHPLLQAGAGGGIAVAVELIRTFGPQVAALAMQLAQFFQAKKGGGGTVQATDQVDLTDEAARIAAHLCTCPPEGENAYLPPDERR
jgi:hypothetical protein